MAETIPSSTQTERERVRGDNIMEIRNARVTFDMDRGRARVLNDIDLDVHRGEILGIVGESGSGKSTLGASLMDAVEDPGMLSGEILYYPEEGGDPISVTELTKRQLNYFRWEEIAVVSQASGNSFNPTITVKRHFIDTFEAHNVDKEVGLEDARERLRELQLDPDRILDSYQHELSGGEKQRAMIALSMVFDPDVLILDEATVGLDLFVQRTILRLLKDINEEYGITMIFITHDIPILAGLADRLAVMYAFNIVELGSVRDVLLSPQHPYTRLLAQSSLNMTIPIDEVRSLEGEPPDPINVPSGCPFHPRCPIADDRCTVEEVERRSEDDSDHEVACFYPDVATDRIPVSIEEGRPNES